MRTDVTLSDVSREDLTEMSDEEFLDLQAAFRRSFEAALQDLRIRRDAVQEQALGAELLAMASWQEVCRSLGDDLHFDEDDRGDEDPDLDDDVIIPQLPLRLRCP